MYATADGIVEHHPWERRTRVTSPARYDNDVENRTVRSGRPAVRALAEVAQLVERHLAKVKVASSSLVFCSMMRPHYREDEPDRRTGTASKAVGPQGWGSRPPSSATSLCSRDVCCSVTARRDGDWCGDGFDSRKQMRISEHQPLERRPVRVR